jgi:hypothetical protein
MLRDLGRVLSKEVKDSDVFGGYLAWSFGWGPLLDDLGKLLDLSKQVNDRLQYLRNLDGGGAKLKRALGTDEFGSTGSYTTSTCTAKVVNKETHKAWFSTRARLVGKLPMSHDDQEWLAARAAFGLNLSSASLWETIPWSWLIDYFANIGDMLAADRGFIPWEAVDMCVMCTQALTSTLEDVKPITGVNVSGGVYTRVTLNRQYYPLPTAGITLFYDRFLTDHQIAILGSLATASSLRSLRL